MAQDTTRARILDAAFACAERFGLARTTLADVAREARLSRQTVYRHFPGRHELFAALVLREEERIIDRVRAAAAPHADLRGALEAAFATCLRAMREHPLLDKVMATEPQELLPYLTVEANPVMSMGMRLMLEVIESRVGGEHKPIVHFNAAEVCARVFISYAITPPRDEPEEIASQLAGLICVGILGTKEVER